MGAVASASGQRLRDDAVAIRKEALRRGWVIRKQWSSGAMELRNIVNGIPFYFHTTNADAADTISTDELQPGGLSGLNLTGNVILGVWDGGAVRTTHQEFGGRAIQFDSAITLLDHATHVAGTMAASGVLSQAMGMSPSAALRCYDWNDDNSELAVAAVNGLRVSSHSYGTITGWFFDVTTGDWFWFGDVNQSPTEDYLFGFYDSEAAEWDGLVSDNTHLLVVKSAGNDRNQGPPAGTGHWYIDPALGDWAWSTATRSLDGDSGYDSLSHRSCSKNVLTVGAVHDVIGGYSGPGSVTMTTFSGWGPTDDGRIKPDVVANGYLLTSSLATGDSDYGAFSGTSMATPSVSGSMGLLLEHFRTTHPSEDDPLASTWKALLIHTADECGPGPGPDYQFGWGLVNAQEAATVIDVDVSQAHVMMEHLLTETNTVFELTLVVTSVVPEVRATLGWTDLPGAPPLASVDPADGMLVEDLNMRLIATSDSTEYYPWVLDPANPAAVATTGVNTVDNVEQIVLTSPPIGSYILEVTHTGLAGDSRPFSLVVTGADELLVDCNGNNEPDQEDISGGTSLDCNGNAVPDECDIATGISNDCDLDTVPDECQFADCNQNCISDSDDIAAATSADCDGNGVPDECDIASETFPDCDVNGVPDPCDLLAGADDCNGNTVPDSCDLVLGGDCNANAVPDDCDISDATSLDCNINGIPDECDLTGNDCNTNGIPDECELVDCNHNCVPDDVEVTNGDALDCNGNLVPDDCDVTMGTSDDLDGDTVPDECQNQSLDGYFARLVAREGAPAPGTDGAFVSLNTTPHINNAKAVAFTAQTIYGSAIYVWEDNNLSPRVIESGAITGSNLVVDSLSPGMAFGDDFSIACSAILSDGRRAVLRSTSAELEIVAAHGDPAPTGGTFDLDDNISPAITHDGSLYFRARSFGEGVGQSGAVFRFEGGASVVIAATGVTYPDVGVFDSIPQGPWAANDGTLLFRANTAGLDRVIRWRAGAMDEVVSETDFAPGFSGGFVRFDAPVVATGPAEVIFGAESNGTPSRGVFKLGLTGQISNLLLSETPSPIPGADYSFFVGLAGNPLGDIVFTAGLTGVPIPGALFAYDQATGTARSLLASGDVAPAAATLLVDDAGRSRANEVGDLVTTVKATDGTRRILLLDQDLLGDIDRDDDVDLDDYDQFLECLEGPDEILLPECAEADFDDDGDIDMLDFIVMQDAFIECEQNSPDCNGNGVADNCEVLGDSATDCNLNGTLDECDIVSGIVPDCNSNWLPDECDIATGESYDFNTNSIPDECEGFIDCNYNGIGDVFDVSRGTSEDCNANIVPDECELFVGEPYLLGNSDGTMLRIDPASPGDPAILQVGIGDLRGLASTCNGLTYALYSNGDIATIDSDGIATQLAGHPDIVWEAAAYDCATATLYGATATAPGPDNALYRISTADGALEFVGEVFPFGMAFDSPDGVLYAINNGNLFELSTVTAHPSLLCDNLFPSQARSLCLENDLLYTVSGNSLYSIDPQTCTAIALGNLPPGTADTTALTCLRESTDCNANIVIDECDIASGVSEDCNTNDLPDECDVAVGESSDCNGDDVPDECQGGGVDCNNDGIDDLCQVMDVPAMYWSDRANGGRIQRILLDATGLSDVVTSATVQPQGLTVDDVAGKVYWGDRLLDNIQRADLDGSNAEVLANLGSATVEDVAVDFASGHVFFCERNADTIERMALDGSGRVSILTGLDDPTGLALHNSALYWTEGGVNSQIRSADTDGQGNTLIVNLPGTYAFGLDVDPIGGKVYWSEPNAGRIQRADLSGGNVEAILIGLGEPRDLALDLPRQHVFWLDNTTDTIHVANLDGSQLQQVVALGSANLQYLQLVRPQTSDCNQNSIPDDCDIASGTSLDDDGNGIPDECVDPWDD
jgi:hypothetical protein